MILRVLRSPAVRLAGTGLAVLLLLRGIDARRTLVGLREADAGWLAAGLGVTALSLVAGTLGWGLLLRSRQRVAWRTLGAWYAQGVGAAQILPAGIGGDLVRGVQASRAAGAPTALACVVGSRAAGALAMAVGGLAAAILLRPGMGSGVLGAAALYAAVIAVGGLLALNAERVVGSIGRPGGRRGRLAARLRPFAAVLSGFGTRARLVGGIVLLGFAGWALQLIALTILARSVGIVISWQLVAVAMPLTMVAAWLPFTANGVGVKEGVLVGMLVHNGVDATHAATLSLLVDLQMLPFAMLGLIVWLAPGWARRRPGSARLSPRSTPADGPWLSARAAHPPAAATTGWLRAMPPVEP